MPASSLWCLIVVLEMIFCDHFLSISLHSFSDASRSTWWRGLDMNAKTWVQFAKKSYTHYHIEKRCSQISTSCANKLDFLDIQNLHITYPEVVKNIFNHFLSDFSSDPSELSFQPTRGINAWTWLAIWGKPLFVLTSILAKFSIILVWLPEASGVEIHIPWGGRLVFFSLI